MRAADLHRLARTLREIALEATAEADTDRVNAGELAVFEDVARHSRSTIRDITERTGLAQSLVSRIVQAAAANGVLSVVPDEADRRKVRIDLTADARRMILDRADNDIRAAIGARAPRLDALEAAELETHLEAAARILRKDDERAAAEPGRER